MRCPILPAVKIGDKEKEIAVYLDGKPVKAEKKDK